MMKAKELIKVLEAADPESNVALQIGGSHADEYRAMCAKAELMIGDCLENLNIDYAVIQDLDGEVFVSLVLEQWNINGLEEIANDFDEKYKFTQRNRP